MKKHLLLSLLLISLVATSSAQVNLAQGLQLYLDFNGNANDQSGNNNNGTVNGATLVQDKWGNPNGAYQFDGVNDFIEVLTSPTLNFNNENFTLYSLVSVQGFYQGRCHGNYLVSRGIDANAGSYQLGYVDALITNNQHCNITIPDTINQNYFAGAGNANAYNGSQANATYVTKNTWTCLVGVATSDSIKLYVDGVLTYKAFRTGSGSANSSNVLIGKHSNVLDPYWIKAIVDEVRIYDRAINLQEVDALCEYAYFPESVNDLSRVKLFEISPNPAKDYLLIKAKEGSYTTNFNIVDVSGKTIQKETALLNTGNDYRLDIHDVSKGLYFLTIEIDGTSETHKMVVE